MEGSLAFYGEMLEAGIPGEDARFVMPNATRTNLVMTANLRALIHMCGLRLCTMAQWEIRRLFQLIRHEVFTVSPFLGSFLAPKCVPLGYCDEDRNRDEHCPIRPHKDNVLAAWAEKRTAAKAAGASCRRCSRRRRPPERRRRRGQSPATARTAAGRSLHEAAHHPGQARTGLVGGQQHLLVGERRRRQAGALVGDQRHATTRMPAQRAASASMTVDMPTASAPSMRSMRTSAGVS